MLRKERTRSRDWPVTFETWKMGQMRWEMNWVAVVMTSAWVLTKRGILRAPGDFRILVSWVMVCWRMWGGQMSTLVMTTMTGTLRARAMPRCSLVVISIKGRGNVCRDFIL